MSKIIYEKIFGGGVRFNTRIKGENSEIEEESVGRHCAKSNYYHEALRRFLPELGNHFGLTLENGFKPLKPIITRSREGGNDIMHSFSFDLEGYLIKPFQPNEWLGGLFTVSHEGYVEFNVKYSGEKGLISCLQNSIKMVYEFNQILKERKNYLEKLKISPINSSDPEYESSFIDVPIIRSSIEEELKKSGGKILKTDRGYSCKL